MRRRSLVWGLAAGLLLLTVFLFWQWRTPLWTEAELAMIRALWIGSLPALPPDPSNRYADDPRAVALGARLFADRRLSSNGAVACTTCHPADLGFQDARPVGIGVGVMNRRTMPLTGAAYSPWFFWDGRKDSQWAQALGPLESPVEHGGTRTQYAHVVAQYYRSEYTAIFGALPDLSDPQRFPPVAGPVDEPTARTAWENMAAADRASVTHIYVNLGKAIAAFERTLLPKPTRFDRYAEALLSNPQAAQPALLTDDEVAGLRLFIGKANCTNCHNGPLLTNNDFHNTGIPPAPGLPVDEGRASGVPKVLADEFNCLSVYSDAAPAACGELRFVKRDDEALVGAFKPPSLRGVAARPPYMHAGQMATLDEVLTHYNQAPIAPTGHSELEPLSLNQTELAQIAAFLSTLNTLP